MPNDIIMSIQRILLFAFPFLFAVILHELGHGYAALLQGDPTAQRAGRLSLNPMNHLDPMGTAVFALTSLLSPVVFGWAKPVPINPALFKNPRKGMVLVSLAGPAANFIQVVIWALLAFALAPLAAEGDGLYRSFEHICIAGIIVNTVLGIFNLLPLPPLDGSKVLAGALPREQAIRFLSLQRYGFLIIAVLLFTGILQKVLIIPLNFALQNIFGLFGLFESYVRFAQFLGH